MGFFDNFFKKKSSGEVAKDRLKLLLVSDRSNCSPETMELIKNDIIQVISKYMEIDPEGLDIQITQSSEESEGPALYANIPIVSIKHTGEMDDEVVEKVQEQEIEEKKDNNQETQNAKTDKETANKTEIKKEENKEETVLEAKKEEVKVEEIKTEKESKEKEKTKKDEEVKTEKEKTVKQEENVSNEEEKATTDVKDDDKKDTEPKETNNEQVNAGVKENNISTKQENKNIITNSQVKQEPVIHNNRKRRNKRRKGRR